MSPCICMFAVMPTSTSVLRAATRPAGDSDKPTSAGSRAFAGADEPHPCGSLPPAPTRRRAGRWRAVAALALAVRRLASAGHRGLADAAVMAVAVTQVDGAARPGHARRGPRPRRARPHNRPGRPRLAAAAGRRRLYPIRRQPGQRRPARAGRRARARGRRALRGRGPAHRGRARPRGGTFLAALDAAPWTAHPLTDTRQRPGTPPRR